MKPGIDPVEDATARQQRISRRAFILDSGTAGLAGWLSLALPAVLQTAQAAQSSREGQAGPRFLSEQDARDFEALAELIFPATSTAGAREAGVIWFIDQALRGHWNAWAAPMLRDLEMLNGGAGGGPRFAALEADEQARRLQSIEDTPFFGQLQFLTLAGVLSMPVHGGNRDRIGWQAIGFENRHAWLPPFGHYDANPGGADPA